MYVKQSKVRGEQKLFALTRGCKLQTLRFWSRLFKYFLLPRDLTSREGSLYVYSSFTDFLFYKTRMRFEMNCRFFLIIRKQDRSYNTERFFEIFRISRSF